MKYETIWRKLVSWIPKSVNCRARHLHSQIWDGGMRPTHQTYPASSITLNWSYKSDFISLINDHIKSLWAYNDGQWHTLIDDLNVHRKCPKRWLNRHCVTLKNSQPRGSHDTLRSLFRVWTEISNTMYFKQNSRRLDLTRNNEGLRNLTKCKRMNHGFYLSYEHMKSPVDSLSLNRLT